MATPQSPFTFLSGLLPGLQPPSWLVDEGQRRIVLLLNHVLQQEPEACSRLRRQKGRVALLQWRQFHLRLAVTPAGLLELAASEQEPDLSVTVQDQSPLLLAQAALRGDKPAIQIAGDVQLAAEINWLVDHVRWDLEEDLARVLGDVPAHALGTLARRVAQAVRQFVGGRAGTAAASGEAPA